MPGADLIRVCPNFSASVGSCGFSGIIISVEFLMSPVSVELFVVGDPL